MSNLPYDAQIEYLEGTGTQYINTGFTNTKSTEFVMDFQLTDATGDRKAIGQGFKFGLGQISNKWRIIDSQWYQTSTDTDTLRHIAYTDNGKYYIDSTQIADRYSQKTAGTYPMLLFAVSSQSSVAPDGNPAKMKLYSCKIYDDGVLVRDFIPVRVGQVGYLYDKVSGQLFGNSGTGDFFLGKVKVLPNPFGFRRRLMIAEKKYIVFEDPAVEALCVANWSSDGTGLTYEDAEAVTSIGSVFSGNSSIVKFNEFKFFTNVTTLSNDAFKDTINLTDIELPENLNTLGDNAFRGSGIIELDMKNVSVVNGNCFYGCPNLQYVKSKNVTQLKGSVFQNCKELKRMILPNALNNASGAQSSSLCYGCYNVDMIDYGSDLINIYDFQRYKYNATFPSGTWVNTTLVIRSTSAIYRGGNTTYGYLVFQGLYRVYVPFVDVDRVTAINNQCPTYAIGGAEWVEQFGSSNEYANLTQQEYLDNYA